MFLETSKAECRGWFSIVASAVGMGLTAFLLSGCVSDTLTRPQMNPTIMYQKDILFHVSYLKKDSTWSNGFSIKGAGVMPEAPSYRIRVLPEGKADMITISSCHREEKNANPPADSWYKDGYTFQVDLVKGLESQKSCPIDIGIYEKKAGRHGWAMMAIESEREKLPAMTKCNGRIKQYDGVSVCQGKHGLIQKYEFRVPVAVASTQECFIPTPADEMNWEFQIPRGTCTVYFIEKANPKNIHQANMYGYDTIPIRGVK